MPPFSVSFVAEDGGTGDADFRVTIGRVNGDTAGSGVEAVLLVGFEGDVDGGVTEEEASVLDDACTAGGVSNSTGRTRGVACTLVINLARSQ